MTIELSPEIEADLNAAAMLHRIQPEKAALNAIAEWARRNGARENEVERESEQEAQASAQAQAEKRRAAVYAALGCLEGQGMSVDEFLADRHAVAVAEAEAEAEAEKDAQRLAP